MKVQVKSLGLKKKQLPAIGLIMFEGSFPSTGLLSKIDEANENIGKRSFLIKDFQGKLNQSALLYPHKDGLATRIILVGLGKKEDFSAEKLRGACAKVGQTAQSLKLKEISVALDADYLGMPWETATEAAVEGIILGIYRFTSFKTVERENIHEIKNVCLIIPEKISSATVKKAVDATVKICEAVYFTKDMVSMPANEMTPACMAQKALSLAKKHKKISTTVLEVEEMKRLGMNALLGVAKGSEEQPKFIIIEYGGTVPAKAPLVLIGKGLTFDSGGISLKPAEKMDEMKSDMSGGAAVMGALHAAANLNLPLNIIGLIPATENLPGGRAYKPGDILKSMSGKTIEVLNTDAEGRLILADALFYAGKFKPIAIIDIATLTGACVVALGEQVIGMMGTDDDLKKRIVRAADQTGERVWELPLWEHYHESIKSDIADYKNSAGRYGGAITAAAFLSKFVEPYPWVHLDIAGPAWITKDHPYHRKGASGIGVRLLVELMRNWLDKD